MEGVDSEKAQYKVDGHPPTSDEEKGAIDGTRRHSVALGEAADLYGDIGAAERAYQDI